MGATGWASGMAGWLAAVSLADFLGAIGVLVYIGAYLALQLGVIRGDGYAFPALNLAASLAVLVSLGQHFNPFSATIEIAWTVISVIGMTRLYLVSRYIRLDPEEQMVATTLIPGLTKDRALSLLTLGRFSDVAAGTELAREEAPLADLSLVIDGLCRIDRGGLTVATIRNGALVGELTYATGRPATASVVAEVPTRVFQIDCVALRAFLPRNPDIAREMEMSISGDLRDKLIDTTRRLAEERTVTGAVRSQDRIM